MLVALLLLSFKAIRPGGLLLLELVDLLGEISSLGAEYCDTFGGLLKDRRRMLCAYIMMCFDGPEILWDTGRVNERNKNVHAHIFLLRQHLSFFLSLLFHLFLVS